MANNGIDPEMINKLMSILQNGNMEKSLSKVADMLGEPKKVEAIKKLLAAKAAEKTLAQDNKTQQLSGDPRVNLLLAIKPFLTEHRAQKVDTLVKSITLSTVVKELYKLM